LQYIKNSLAGWNTGLTVAVVLLLCFVRVPSKAQFFYNDSCRHATGIFEVRTNQTGIEPGVHVGYTAGFDASPDPDGDGWLRLTTISTGSQLGYVLLDKEFPVSQELTVEFDFKTWGGWSDYADGFSVFLYDGSVSLADFIIGGYGGGLGYSNVDGSPGLYKAYIGIGIDEYGAFGGEPHTISIKDDQYQYAGGTQSFLKPNLDLNLASSKSSRPSDAEFYRRVRIKIVPAGTNYVDVTVSVKSDPDGQFVQALTTYVNQTTAPLTLKMGFCASTGLGRAYHEIRDVLVRLEGAVSVQKILCYNCQCNDTPNDVHLRTIINNSSHFSFPVLVRDTFPATYTLTGAPTVSSGAFVDASGAPAEFPSSPVIAPNGSTVYEYYIKPDALSQTVVNFHGRIAHIPFNGEMYSNAGITPPSVVDGFTFYDNPDDNYVSHELCIRHYAVNDTLIFQQGGGQQSINVKKNDKTRYPCYSPVLGTVVEPKRGTVTALDDSTLVYIPNAGFAGWDSLTYYIKCGADSAAAKVYIEIKTNSVTDYPDNVLDGTCLISKSQNWGIQKKWTSDQINLSHLLVPFVGDLDSDGTPEIVCFTRDGRTDIPDGKAAKTLVVYNGKTGERIRSITMDSWVTEYDAAAYGLVRSKDGKGLIVVATIDYKLRAYDITKDDYTVPVWVSDVNYGSVQGDVGVNIGFADFNQDGSPELYVRNKVYDASTGVLLATAPDGSNTGSSWAHWTHNGSTQRKLSSPIAADVIGDSRLELILGNEIYEVDVDNNSINLLKTVTPPDNIVADGHAQVADFNGDGRLDILITNRNNKGYSGTVSLYVWDVYNNQVSYPEQILTTMSGKSIPLIADVDNDGKPEVAIQCARAGNKTVCYKYDAATMTFSKLWDHPADEDSYSNALTIFDFNNDGMNEVLFTDQRGLKILNGSGKSHITGNDTVPVYPMAYFNQIYLTTIMQYPVVADIDGDGSAEIVMIGGNSSTIDADARIHVFESSGVAWAPARKVWNQYMYNAVNINEDLTVPKVQFNSATKFAGHDGILDTEDDIYPFNNFLQQQTMLNRNGEPVWLLPATRTVASSSKLSYNSQTDALTVSIDAVNDGAAVFNTPFSITAYGNSVGSSPQQTYSHTQSQIKPDETVKVSFDIPNFLATWAGVNQIAVRLNDAGNGFSEQTVCDSLDRDYLFSVLAAVNDSATVTENSVNNLINITDNDLVPCGSPVTGIAVEPTKGVATVQSGNIILYTPNAGFAGLDSLTYYIKCGADSATAKVYIEIAEQTGAGVITPSDTTVCAGSDVTLNLIASGTVDGWERSETPDDPTSWTFISGSENQLTYQLTNLNITTYCRAIVDGSPVDTAVIRVNPLPSAPDVSVSFPVCAGQPFDITVSNATVNSIYKIYDLSDGGSLPIYISDAASSGTFIFTVGGNSLTAPSVAGQYVWYVSADNGDCESSLTEISINVNTCVATVISSDTVLTTVNTPVTVNVADNDMFMYGCTPTYSLPAQPTPLHGSANITGDGSLSYVPDMNFTGIDSLKYDVSCNGVYAGSASVYILIYDPVVLQYIACPDAYVTMRFRRMSGVSYNWYEAATNVCVKTGTDDNDVACTVQKGLGNETFHVRFVVNGVELPSKWQINVELIDNSVSGTCGGDSPPNCATSGTVLFREDFGGNSYSDDDICQSDMLGNRTNCIPDFSPVSFTHDHYWLLKYSPLNNTVWHSNFSDHTHWADINKGYMFLTDATFVPKQFYEQEMTDLCGNTNLFFSVWAGNLISAEAATDFLNSSLKFELVAYDGSILASFTSGEIPRDPLNSFKWHNFGFQFYLPAGQDRVTLKIYNNTFGDYGNDLVLDDIEVRLCAPPVSISGDVQLCVGGQAVITADYSDGGIFGSDLKARWYKNVSGDLNNPLDWTAISGSEKTSDNGLINHSYTFSHASLSDEGWYRLAVADHVNIDRYNCRAMSEIIHVKVENAPVPPDVRLLVQPSAGLIPLNQYLDSIVYTHTVSWQPPVSSAGILNVSGWQPPATQVFTCDINTQTCGTMKTKVYIRAIGATHVKTATVYICKDLDASRLVNLNRILGVAAAGGAWSYPDDPNVVIASNVITASSDSQYAGALFFNAQQAYAQAGADYGYGAGMKKFEFEYSNGSGVTKKIMLIIF
jgi:hypothetical protein